MFYVIVKKKNTEKKINFLLKQFSFAQKSTNRTILCDDANTEAAESSSESYN